MKTPATLPLPIPLGRSLREPAPAQPDGSEAFLSLLDDGLLRRQLDDGADVCGGASTEHPVDQQPCDETTPLARSANTSMQVSRAVAMAVAAPAPAPEPIAVDLAVLQDDAGQASLVMAADDGPLTRGIDDREKPIVEEHPEDAASLGPPGAMARAGSATPDGRAALAEIDGPSNRRADGAVEARGKPALPPLATRVADLQDDQEGTRPLEGATKSPPVLQTLATSIATIGTVKVVHQEAHLSPLARAIGPRLSEWSALSRASLNAVQDVAHGNVMHGNVAHGNVPPLPSETPGTAPSMPVAMPGLLRASSILTETAASGRQSADPIDHRRDLVTHVARGEVEHSETPALDAEAPRPEARASELRTTSVPPPVRSSGVPSPVRSSTDRQAGAAPVSGASPRDTSPLADPPVAAQIANAITTAVAGGTTVAEPEAVSRPIVREHQAGTVAPSVRIVKLALAPVELGPVTLVLSARGNELTVRVEAEQPDTVDRVSSERDQLVQRLSNAGYQIQDFSVARSADMADARPQHQSAPNSGGTGASNSSGASGQGDGGHRSGPEQERTAHARSRAETERPAEGTTGVPVGVGLSTTWRV